MQNLSKTLEAVGATASTNEKQELILNHLTTLSPEDQILHMKFLSNEILPFNEEFNVGGATIITALSKMTGHKSSIVKEKATELGSVSLAVEYFISTKKNRSLFATPPLPLSKLFYHLQKLPTVSKTNDKSYIIQTLLSNQSPQDAKFISNFMIQDLKLGYSTPTLLNVLSTILQRPEYQVKMAYNYTNSVTKLLTVDLGSLSLTVHQAIRPQLADNGGSGKDIITKQFSTGDIAEFKYDGGRGHIHATANKVSIFSRNLEDITSKYPEITQAIRTQFPPDSPHLPFVLDEELMVGTCFEDFLTRNHRKHDIKEYVDLLPATAKVFDILMYAGEDITKKPLEERKKILRSLELSEPFELVKSKKTNGDPEIVRAYYEKALKLGHEGIIVKDSMSPYIIGQRDPVWLKYKPNITVDLQVVEAKYGTGGNAGLYSSFVLATSEGLTIGGIGSGLKDHMITELNERWNNGEKIIIEVTMDILQKSSKYTSGYAMRFPRVKSIYLRDDKDEANSLEEILAMAD